MDTAPAGTLQTGPSGAQASPAPGQAAVWSAWPAWGVHACPEGSRRARSRQCGSPQAAAQAGGSVPSSACGSLSGVTRPSPLRRGQHTGQCPTRSRFCASPAGTGWGLCVSVCAPGSRHADGNLAFPAATLFSPASRRPQSHLRPGNCSVYTEAQALQAWSRGPPGSPGKREGLKDGWGWGQFPDSGP